MKTNIVELRVIVRLKLENRTFKDTEMILLRMNIATFGKTLFDSLRPKARTNELKISLPVQWLRTTITIKEYLLT